MEVNTINLIRIVTGDFQMKILLLLIFLFCHIFLSFSAFYGRISCIHCQMLCDLQKNLVELKSDLGP